VKNKIFLVFIFIITNSAYCNFTLSGIIRSDTRQLLNKTVSSSVETYGQLMNEVYVGSGSFYLLFPYETSKYACDVKTQFYRPVFSDLPKQRAAKITDSDKDLLIAGRVEFRVNR
jgi:hypothetical protein